MTEWGKGVADKGAKKGLQERDRTVKKEGKGMKRETDRLKIKRKKVGVRYKRKVKTESNQR